MTIHWRTTTAKLRHSFRKYILHPELVQVGPLALILLVISISGMYATGANFAHDQFQVNTVDGGIAALQQAPNNLRTRLTDAYLAGDINEAQYQVQLERLDRLTPLFQQYAQRLDQAADIEFRLSSVQALVEYLLAGAPLETRGALTKTSLGDWGWAVNSVISSGSTGSGVSGLLDRLTGSSDFDRYYQQLEAQLGTEIDQVLRVRSVDLLKARLAHMIGDLQNEWLDLQLKFPNDINRAYAEFGAYLDAKAKRYADQQGLIAAFDTPEDFSNWLSTQVDFDARPGDNVSQPLLEASSKFIYRGECATLRWVVPGDFGSIQLSGDGVEAQGDQGNLPSGNHDLRALRARRERRRD